MASCIIRCVYFPMVILPPTGWGGQVSGVTNATWMRNQRADDAGPERGSELGVMRWGGFIAPAGVSRPRTRYRTV